MESYRNTLELDSFAWYYRKLNIYSLFFWRKNNRRNFFLSMKLSLFPSINFKNEKNKNKNVNNYMFGLTDWLSQVVVLWDYLKNKHTYILFYIAIYMHIVIYVIGIDYITVLKFQCEYEFTKQHDFFRWCVFLFPSFIL